MNKADLLTETTVEEDFLEALEEPAELVLFNDDHNSFDHVIYTLVKVCKITVVKAEKIVLTAHHEGQATVEIGSYQELQIKRDGIVAQGIWAEVL